MSVPPISSVDTGNAPLDAAINAVVTTPVNDTVIKGINEGVDGLKDLYDKVKDGAKDIDGVVSTVKDDFEEVGRVIDEIISFNILGYLSQLLKDAIGVSIDTAIIIVVIVFAVWAMGIIGGVLSFVRIFI